MRPLALAAALGCAACYQTEPGALCGIEVVTAALDASGPGDVVKLGACRIEGAVTVPAGVTLEGVSPEDSVLVGPEEGVAVTLVPGAAPAVVQGVAIRSRGCGAIVATGPGDVRVQDVAIRVSRGLGVALQGGVGATLADVVIAGPVTADNATAWGPAEGDLPPIGLVAAASRVEMRGVEARGFGSVGVTLSDSTTRWEGGLVEEHLGAGLLAAGGDTTLEDVSIVRTLQGARLGPSIGLVLLANARLDAVGTVVRDGDGIGVLAVGSTGTFADGIVEDNGDVGVWIAASTSFVLEGGRVAGNALAGVLVQASSGITLRDLVVERTAPASLITGGGHVAELADGVDLSGSTTAIVLERVALRGHARAGAVIDLDGGDGGGITLTDVSVEGDGLGVVSQGGRPRVGWDVGVARAGDTADNDARFAESGEALYLPAATPTPSDDRPLPPLCTP